MKSIENAELKNKKVIIRVDYNVPLNENLEITDDNRIKESLKTINYCITHEAKIILLSHLGKVKEEKDLKTKSLRVVAKRLSELIKSPVTFIPKTRGIEVENAINNMKNGDIVMLENTRFEDLDGNNQELAKYWASLGDIFINDAFGTAHRAHASNVGIASNIKESYLGFLVLKEIENLSKVTNNPKKPFIVILGGAKVHDKIGTIENLIKKADYILVGGAMAYTFLYAKGLNIGKSLIDEDSLLFCQNLLKTTDKLILPIDHVVGESVNSKTKCVKTQLENNDMGLDIGPKTRELFKSYLKNSKTIFWNGPLGYTENKIFEEGTREIAKFISNLNTTSIVGGGDTAAVIINMGYAKKFTHISTGGGASLELIEGKELPGINI